ncbi:hypothetical protein SVAN01_07471 [Stagonosporopsis vannaccii]|nr:hypothetical protein SVAN01_07471 [Stagonosporopsis vannaccii]
MPKNAEQRQLLRQTLVPLKVSEKTMMSKAGLASALAPSIEANSPVVNVVEEIIERWHSDRQHDAEADDAMVDVGIEDVFLLPKKA